MTNDIKEKAKVLETFLNEKGYKVKHTHCIEAISHVNHGECYNVAKHKTLRVLKGNETFTFKELKADKFSVDVIVSVGIDTFLDGIDAFNECVSEMITGSDYALCNIDYQPYPYFFNDGGVAIRVTGYIEEIDALNHLADYEEYYEEDEE